MAKIAVYPGSFDPITLGHLSVIRRAKTFCDELYVLVAHNPNKKNLFTQAERAKLIEASCQELGIAGVKVIEMDSGLLADAAEKLNAQIIIKGLRTSADLDYELQFASMNRDLTGIETIFLPTEPQFSQTSSSLIREVASLGGDVSGHVSKAVLSALRSRS